MTDFSVSIALQDSHTQLVSLSITHILLSIIRISLY